MEAIDEGAAGPGRLDNADDHAGPVTRASDRERDAAVQRVQEAFADGRLDDAEFDERMRAALTARTHADLDMLTADLPAATAGAGPAPVTGGGGPGRFAIAPKSSGRPAGARG